MINSRSKLDQPIEIDVAWHRVREGQSERLLVLIVNNRMTWENHIYGDKSNSGLISKLEQRAAMIWKLSYIMPIGRLKQIAQGIFFSLLDYCIELYGNTWCLGSTKDTAQHSEEKTTERFRLSLTRS